eukprot:TRINITY_DN4907_c0_g2_i1.p1 TRINITY_DN4907_c0_g2~~TRINITY_DN4907_c0_g2_i1.p1  ORF type:complete len:993 (-),score=158.50 TRINITY_DN4907_c0_g2_i1:25-3003(-)
MRCQARTLVVLLLGLFSLVVAFESKEQQLIGAAENDEFPPIRDADPAEDQLNQQARNIVFHTARRQSKVNRIRSGTVKIRIQIPSTDLDTMFCVTRVSGPIDYLGVARCQYVADQFFAYNVENGTLQSYGAETDGYWVPAKTVPTELKDIFTGNLPFILTRTQPSSREGWGLFVPATVRVVYTRKGFQVNFCMVASVTGWRMTISAKMVWNAWGRCPMMHILTPADDQLTGPIVQFRLNQTESGRWTVVQQCATFSDTAVLPRSALVMKDCVPGAVNQQFTYNIITKHLFSTVNNAGLFFWWRGPIKALPDLSDDDEGYGWNVPIRRPGSIVAVDHRGYSGVCWSNLNDDVIAGQNCGTFAMLPTQFTLLYRLVNRADVYQSVFVTEQTRNNMTRCLTIRRMAQANSGQSPETSALWDFYFDTCDFGVFRLDQRFVLASPSIPCTPTYCKGTLRWAGDTNVMVTPSSPATYHAVGVTPLVGSSIMEGYLFVLPYQRFDRIQRMSGNRTACISNNNPTAILTDKPTACATLRVLPIDKISPESLDSQVTIIARYDYRSMWAVPNDRNTNPNYDTLRRDLNHEPSQDFKDKFGRDFDYFVGDLGATGVRRFRVLGSGLHPQPSGELRANTDPDHPNGITLPLQYDDIQSYDYISIDLYFRVNRDEIRARGKKNSFLLMSFARSAGCVVYVTFMGKPGIQCYRKGDVFASDQVLQYPQDLFDGRFHKVSVLFPPTSSTGFIQLFVDGQLISHLVRDQWWSMANTGQSVNFFYDPNFWMYQPLPASLLRASLVGAQNYTLIREIAARKAILTAKFQGDSTQIVKVPAITTVWRGCKLIRGTGVHYEGLVCSVLARQNGTHLTLPRDVFSLGCSRPGCSISFLPNQARIADQYRFIYRPNYPEGFVSENVGDPALFQDPARLTDGFKTETVSFGLKFTPEDTTDTEDQDNQDSNHHDGTNLLQVGIADVAKYRCTQSCCVRVGSIEVRTDSLTDEIF